MLLTIGEIIQRFRTHGACVKFSKKTITHMANVLGFHKQRIGGKIGYDQSLITAITQRLDDAIAYENSLKKKTPQKLLKQSQMSDYYTYNGERDNVDYDWEKNENKHMKNNRRIIKEDGNVMTGLWLDDSRKDPVVFLNKANDKSESGAVVRDWYNKNMNGVNIQWTAVTNYWQFKNYILKNGVPDFVSLDHDLGKDPQTGALKKSGQYYPTGTDCAMFLTSYCLRKHIPLPKHYIHSANDNQRVYISKVFRLAKMGKDPLEGVDLNNDEEIGKAADNFRHGIMGTKEMVKQGQLGTADRLARIKGIKDPNDLFRKKKDIYRENRNMKKLIRLTESDLHKIVKESVKKILKEFGSFDINDWYNTEDMGGYTGERGMFKLYNTGDWPVEEAEEQAREEGTTLEGLFKNYLDSVDLSKELDFSWYSDGDFIGGSRDIFRYKNFVVKEWEGEIYFTEYPPQI